MEKHGTTFPGWYITFQQAALAALPRPPQIDQDTALGWSGNGESLSRVLAKILLPGHEDKSPAQPIFPAVPADDKWFELEVDNDIDPMEVVCSAVHDTKDWKYLGPKFKGRVKYRAKLVRLGHVRNLDEARDEANKMGYRLLEGQAQEPFKKKFPKPKGKGPVVFGGSEWQSPHGGPHVIYLHDVWVEWFSYFHWSERGFRERYRWVVVNKVASP